MEAVAVIAAAGDPERDLCRSDIRQSMCLGRTLVVGDIMEAAGSPERHQSRTVVGVEMATQTCSGDAREVRGKDRLGHGHQLALIPSNDWLQTGADMEIPPSKLA
eukprot:g36022.t1